MTLKCIHLWIMVEEFSLSLGWMRDVCIGRRHFCWMYFTIRDQDCSSLVSSSSHSQLEGILSYFRYVLRQ